MGVHSSGASVPVRLALMMFLQYFALGAWIVPLTRYLQTAPVEGGLGFAPSQVGYIYMTFAVGALVAPLVVGLLADRWFAVERVIAVHQCGDGRAHGRRGVVVRQARRHGCQPGSTWSGRCSLMLLGYAIGVPDHADAE